LSCDAWVSVACTDICAAQWTERIDEEWMRSLVEKCGRAPADFASRRDDMRVVCPDREVTIAAWLPFEAGQEVLDPDDRHVLAAAIA
jgi:hypothetical protein